MWYLVKYNLFLALLCAPAGYALVGNNQVSPIIAAKLNWSASEDDFYNTIMSSCGILGLVLGSLLSGKFVKKGRRLSALWLALLVIISSGMQIVWMSVIPICIGRLLFGFASGALVTCANCMLKETVPDSLRKTFCVTVNFGIELGLMICLFVGMPLTDLTRE